MSVLEYRTVDKADWGPGEWQDEPDKRQWTDEGTGLPCLLVRHSRTGHLCGYVGVPAGHRFYGIGYDDVSIDSEDHDEAWPPAHGGLTFAGPCHEGPEETSVCHVPAPGEPDDVWWLGFDCGHAFDLAPGMMADYRRRYEETGDSLWLPSGHEGSYRSARYVMRKCEHLALWLSRNAS